MAKVKTWEFAFLGQDYKVNVNINSKGIFSANIPDPVYDYLNIDRKITASSLSELESKFLPILDSYIKDSKEYRLFIELMFKSSGDFNHSYETKHTTFSSSSLRSSIWLSYRILALETSASGNEVWYRTEDWSECYEKPRYKGRKPRIENDFTIGDYLISGPSYKVINYSKEAVISLDRAKEGLSKISQILTNLYTQDSDAIATVLQSGNILQLQSA